MRRGLVIVVIAAALVAVPAADALLSQQGVKTTRLYEQVPAAAEDGSTQYFAWSQNSRAHRNHFDAFLTRTGDSRVKLNAKGEGYVGGIDPPMVAYQQVVNGNSDLKIYDADAQTRTNPPGGVNTFDWEWEPSISGDWLLFGRQTSWTRCNRTTCNVVRRQISTVSDTVLSKPTRKLQYGAAVTGDGIVYVARSGAKCGADVKIVRYFGVVDPAGGTIVADLGANGRDFWSAYAKDNADGSVDVFYDRYVCGRSTSDIYRVNDPHPGP